MKAILASALAGVLMMAASQASLAGETLSQTQLRSLFPGSFYAIVKGVVALKITASGNGKLVGTYKDKKDTGRWSLSGSKLCIVWTTWDDGKSNCSTVVADGGWYHGSGVRFRKL